MMSAPAERAPARLRPVSCPVCAGAPSRAVLDLSFLPDAPPGMYLVRCAGCGCERIDPQPLPEDLAAGYDTAYYADGYLPFEARRRADFRNRVEELADFAPIRAARAAGRPPRILDIGAGLGWFALEAMQAGFEVAAFEPSGAARDLARERLGLELRADWPAAVEPFDVVTLWDVLGHVADPVATLAAARARLGTGGGIVVKVPNFRSAWHRVRRHMAARRGVNILHATTVVWRPDRRALGRLLDRTRFRPESVTTVREPDLVPLTPRWRLVRRLTDPVDRLFDNRDELILRARAC